MRSLLGRFHRPMSRGLVNNMLTMNNLGDGSTLSLDFTTGVLDPRLTFSRASTATFVNSSGYVEYAGANLLLQSETISTSPWTDQSGATRLQVSITNPINGATSTQVTSGTANNAIFQVPTYQAGLPHVIRLWVRAGTSSQLQLGMYAGGFVTGTISVISGTATVSNTGLFLVTGLTSTWTQLQIVYPSLTGSGTFLIYPDTASPVLGRTIYVWGAQLNPGSTAQTYYPTTTPAYHAPRFDYSPTNIGEPRGLLIEGLGTTINNYGEAFDNAAWAASQIDKTGMTTSQTDPANGTNARILKADANAGRHALYQITGTNPGTGTLTVWAKAKELGFATLALANANESKNVNVTFDLATGATSGVVATGGATHVASDAVQFNHGWWRLRLTTTITAGGYPDNLMMPWVGLANASGSAGRSFTASGSGIYIYGAQLEAGVGASSYIPTGASQVTRTADSCLMSGTNFSSWFNNTEGTCLFVGDNSFVPAASNFSANWALISAANSMRINNYTRHTSGRLGASPRDSGGTALTFDSPTGSPTNITTTAVYKTAFAMKTNDFAYCVNGNTVGLGDGNGVFDTVTSIEFARDGIRNGHMKQFKFYPTRLTNAELQAITAP